MLSDGGILVTTASFPNPDRNLLLAALPAAEQRRVFPKLEPVELKFGAVVHESYERPSHVYFPVDCLLSTLYEIEGGETVECSIVGNEGIAGVLLLLGGESTPNRTIVKHAGHAYRLKREVIQAEFDRHDAIHDLSLRYVQFLWIQTSQAAICNRHHTLEQRLCRALLMSVDRLGVDRLHMTQQLLADALGVRREGVTQVAGGLQRLGLISYSRGDLSVLDRTGLEKRCCECYAIVNSELEHLLSAPPPAAGSESL